MQKRRKKTKSKKSRKFSKQTSFGSNFETKDLGIASLPMEFPVDIKDSPKPNNKIIQKPFNSNVPSPGKSLIDLQLIAKPQSTSSSEDSKSGGYDLLHEELVDTTMAQEELMDNMQRKMTKMAKDVNKMVHEFRRGGHSKQDKKNVGSYLNQRLGIDAFNMKRKKVITNRIIDFEYNAIR